MLPCSKKSTYRIVKEALNSDAAVYPSLYNPSVYAIARYFSVSHTSYHFTKQVINQGVENQSVSARVQELREIPFG